MRFGIISQVVWIKYSRGSNEKMEQKLAIHVYQLNCVGFFFHKLEYETMHRYTTLVVKMLMLKGVPYKRSDGFLHDLSPKRHLAPTQQHPNCCLLLKSEGIGTFFVLCHWTELCFSVVHLDCTEWLWMYPSATSNSSVNDDQYTHKSTHVLSLVCTKIVGAFKSVETFLMLFLVSI